MDLDARSTGDDRQHKEGQNQKRKGKRKRSSHGHYDSNDPRVRLPKESINPLSHTPGTLKQLALAGLTDQDFLPSVSNPRFPHRALDAATSAESESESEAESVSGANHETEAQDTAQGPASFSTAPEPDRPSRPTSTRTPSRPHWQLTNRHVRPLIKAIEVSLEAGDIPRAKRAFSVLVRLAPSWQRLDLRLQHLWELGAEILMREGEGSADERTRRWGLPQNRQHVRRYYEYLIKQYPWNRLQPDRVSAADFWPPFVEYEMYHIYSQQVRALKRLEDQGEDSEDGEQEETLSRKDDIRRRALEDISRIAETLEGLVHREPHWNDAKLLDIYGNILLYLGDLEVPARMESHAEREQALARRQRHRDKAEQFMQKAISVREMRSDGHNARRSQSRQGSEDERTYHSLPLRGTQEVYMSGRT